ncbi:unnamed protein product [Closterium sp. NIES-53]
MTSSALDGQICLGIAVAALGASESGTLPGTAPSEALHTFTLDSGASRCFFRDSTTLTPLPAPIPGSLSGLHLPSFSTNLTLLWHHHLGHPSLPRLRGMHSHLLDSGLPRSLPPLPPSPAPPCLPCVEGRQRAAPHSSSFPPTTAPLQTLHMDMWGPARVSGQGRERYFLLVVDDYTRYTSVFPLRSKGEVVDVLIPWIRRVRLQLRERFRQDLPVVCLHSDRGGDFSANLLQDICRGEGILRSFTLPDSPKKNGIAEHRIGLVMEVARTSMIHAAAPHFLWPFAVWYAAHQLNLWPRVSLPETSPTLRWTGKVGDALVFRVWGSRAFVLDTSADKLSARAIPFVFLGFVPDAPGWQFYHPTSRRVLPSQDITFDESVPFYRLFPYRSAPPLAPPLFLAPGPPPVDPLPPQGPAPSGVSQVDPLPGTAPVQGAGSGGAEFGGEEPGGAEPAGVEPGGVEPGGAELEGAESGGAASSEVPAGASWQLSPQQLREWLVRRARLWSGATGAGSAADAGAGGAGVTAGPRGARTRGAGAAGTGGVGDAGARDSTEPGVAGAGGSCAGGSCAGGAGAGGSCAGGAGAGGAGAGVGGPGAGGTGATGAGAVDPGAGGAGGTVRPRPYFVPLLQQILGVPSSTSLTPPLLCPPPDKSQPPLLSASPLPAPSPYSEQTGDRTERCEPASHPSAAAFALVAELLDFAAACRLDYATALDAESASASPPSVGGECALGTDVLEDKQEDFECLAAAVPRFASMLLAPEGDLDAPDIPTPRSYAEAITGPYSSQRQATMDAEMVSWKSTGTYVNEVPPPVANMVDGMWIFRRDYELHSLIFSTPFLQGNLHEGIWLRRPPGFTGSFPAGTQWSLRRPVYDLRQAPREWHDTLRTTLAALGFAPSTADPSLFLRTDTSLPPFYVLVYVNDLVFATADTEALTLVKSELQKSHTYTDLGELRSYLGLQITGDRARRTITLTQSHMVHQVLQRFGFQFSSPQPNPLSTGHSLSAPPSDEFVEPSGPYPELVGCLMYMMTCTRTDLAYPLSLLAHYVAPGRHRKVHWDAAKRVLRYLYSTSGMGLVLGRRGPVVLTGHADASWVDDSATQRSSEGYTFSLGSGFVSWQSTRSSLFLSSSCEAEIYAGAMAAQELRWLTYLLTDLGEQPRSPLVLYVDNRAMIALCQEHRLEHRTKHIALRYFLALELQQRGQLRLAYVATRANTPDVFTKSFPPGDHPRFSTVLGLLAFLFLTGFTHVSRLPSTNAYRFARRRSAHSVTLAQRDSRHRPPRPRRDLHTSLLLCDRDLSESSMSTSSNSVHISPAPPATADSATRSQWLTRDAAARLAIRNHLPLAECTHFGQHRHLEDLVSHLRTCDARYRAAIPVEFLPRNQPPMFISLYFLVTRLPDSLRSVRDHFLALDPTVLTVDLLEQHLLAAETSVVAVGAARGIPRTPFFEGCSPSPLAPSYASAAAVDVLGAEDVGTSSASGKRRSSKGKGGGGGGGGSEGGGGGSSRGGGGSGGGSGSGSGGESGGFGSGGSGSGGGGGNGGSASGGGRARATQRGGSGGGQRQQQQSQSETPSPQQLCEWISQCGASGGSGSCPYVIRTGDQFGDEAERPCWAELLRSGVAIFDLDYDAILTAMYALSISNQGGCYLCVPPGPGIEAVALGASESALLGTAPAEALHTFALDSGASCCFFRDSTTLTPLSAPVPVRLSDPSGGPVLARSSTVLLCPAVPSGSLLGLHLPSFSTNLEGTAALQDAMVTTTTPGGQRVSICTCTQTGCHLATFTRWPGSSLYTLATEPPQVAASAQVSASGPVAPPCSCRLLSHQILMWHHRLGHPSLPRLRGMHSRLLVSGLPRSLPPLPPSPAPPCLPCVEGRQRAVPHSSSFPPTIAPLQTLHMDVWGPSRVSGQGRERYFLLVVDDYTRYTTVFPLRSKGGVPDVLIPWIRAVRLHLRERFHQDLPVLRLHSDRGGEFFPDFLRDLNCGEGILQSFTLLDSPQQNGIAKRRIGLVMEVARTSMIHAAAPHFLWPFAVWYAAHQLNLWPRVSLSENLQTLHWTGKVGDASVFRVWGFRAFVRDTSADKLSARAIPFVFLGFVPDAPGWQFYHPTFRRVFPSQDVMFDESVPFYRLFPNRSAPPLAPPLFLAPGPPPVDPLPPQGPAPSGVSQVDPLPGTVPVEVAVDSGAARGAASGVESGGAEPEGVELGGAESGGAEPRGAASSGGPAGVSPRLSPRPEPLSPQQLREWFTRCIRLRSGAAGAGDSVAGDTGAGGAGVTAGAGGTGGAAAAGPGGARTRGTGADRTGSVGGARAGDPTEHGAAGAGGAGAGGPGAGGAGAGGAGAVDPGAGGAGAGGAGAGGAVSGGSGAGGTVWPRPYFVPLLQQTGGLTERCEPASRPASPVRTGHRVPRPRLPPFNGTHAMAVRPSSVPLHVPLLPPPESSLPAIPDPEPDRARAASPTVSRLLTTVVMDPSFESNAASALVAELVDFAAAYCLDYATALVAKSESASPPSVGGTYVDAFPPSRINIVDGMWIFKRDYELHSLDFSVAFLQGSMHEEIWLRRPPGFTGSFLAGTQWSLRRPVYDLRHAPRKWHDTLRTTLVALGFTPSTADPSLFLRTDTSLPPFYVLVYVDDLIFAAADTEALTLVKSELQKRHTCTDLGELRSYLGLQITRDRARCTITLTRSHMVHQALQRFGFQYSSLQPTPVSTSHSLSAPPSDESVELNGPYPELVGCLMYPMTCTRPDLAYPLSLLARYVAPVCRAWGS